MASSEDPLSIHQTFNIDSWLNSDSDILSKALHRSITESSPFFDSNTDLSPPRTLSNVSFNSLPEIDPPPAVGTKRKRGGLGVSNGVKPAKRKSRVSSSTKKSLTTFINADAANFRQMVQQVTGAKFIGGGGAYGIPILKPEPHRLVAACGTLDTSSFLSNHHHQQNVVTDFGSVSAPIDSFSHQSSAVNTTVNSGVGGGGSAVEFDSNPSCFPTLESWTVI